MIFNMIQPTICESQNQPFQMNLTTPFKNCLSPLFESGPDHFDPFFSQSSSLAHPFMNVNPLTLNGILHPWVNPILIQFRLISR